MTSVASTKYFLNPSQVIAKEKRFHFSHKDASH